jgi:hypothetical protein
MDALAGEPMSLTVLWTVLSLLSAVLAAYNLREAVGDRHATRRRTRDPVVRLAADAAVRRMSMTFIVFGTFLGVGAAALLWPGRGVAGYVIAGGLMLSLIVMGADTVLRTLARRAMQQAARATLRDAHATADDALHRTPLVDRDGG